MSQRRKNPALYELLGSRPINKPGGGRPPVEDPIEDDQEDSAFGIKPGRTIRIPVGYLFFAIAGVIALIFGGYMLGYAQRDRIAEQEKLRALTSDDPDGGGGGAIADPLNRVSSEQNTPNRPNTDGATRQVNNSGSTANPPRTGSPLENVWFVREGVRDPREPGLNYFILATNYPWDEAERAALYLGKNGVAAVVYPSSRSNRWNLSTRRGFEGGTFRDREAQDLVDRIKQIGERFQSTERGATDFDDLYPARLD
ncbi:MAG: hypothetical protein NXI14_11925 [bacterium]|nr:hypothetical protein [bacterium]